MFLLFNYISFIPYRAKLQLFSDIHKNFAKKSKINRSNVCEIRNISDILCEKGYFYRRF